MSDRISIVLKGFTELTSEERIAFVKELNEYIVADYQRKVVLNEGFEKRATLSLGPINSDGCPCCGRK